MPLDLSDTLVIGISTTALFNMSEGDTLFRTEFAKDRNNGIKIYRKYMLERENIPLEAGTGLPVVRSLLKLKGSSSDEELFSLRSERTTGNPVPASKGMFSLSSMYFR